MEPSSPDGWQSDDNDVTSPTPPPTDAPVMPDHERMDANATDPADGENPHADAEGWETYDEQKHVLAIAHNPPKEYLQAPPHRKSVHMSRARQICK